VISPHILNSLSSGSQSSSSLARVVLWGLFVLSLAAFVIPFFVFDVRHFSVTRWLILALLAVPVISAVGLLRRRKWAAWTMVGSLVLANLLSVLHRWTW
jgi:hypothetical protein